MIPRTVYITAMIDQLVNLAEIRYNSRLCLLLIMQHQVHVHTYEIPTPLPMAIIAKDTGCVQIFFLPTHSFSME